jgi:hypothetical protein
VYDHERYNSKTKENMQGRDREKKLGSKGRCVIKAPLKTDTFQVIYSLKNKVIQ